MEARRDVFQAIADPTRRAIILLLFSNAMTPNTIAANFDCSRQAISKHIQILSECQLLKQRQDGREIYYQADVSALKQVAEFIEPFRRSWEERFTKLDQVLNKLQGTETHEDNDKS